MPVSPGQPLPHLTLDPAPALQPHGDFGMPTQRPEDSFIHYAGRVEARFRGRVLPCGHKWKQVIRVFRGNDGHACDKGHRYRNIGPELVPLDTPR